jgi:hypothetical protein
MRLKYSAGPWSLSNTVEYVPTLVHAEAPFPRALAEDSILRNLFSGSFQITKAIRLREEVSFTRDPTLARQVDCSATPDSMLCDGMIVAQKTVLDFSFSVK